MKAYIQVQGIGWDSGSPQHYQSDKIPPGSSSSGLPQTKAIRALMVEDAPEVVNSVVLSLIARWPGMTLVATGSGSEAVQLAQHASPDIVLLDLTLNEGFGLLVLKEIRTFSRTPVIIITANNEETTRRRSFELGATDYLVKPFSYIDILTSIYATLGRVGWMGIRHEDISLTGQGLVIDLVGRKLLRNGTDVRLTGLEWRVLGALIHRYGQLTSRVQLAQAGWGRFFVPRALILNCVRQLRVKLGDDPAHPALIQYKRNKGYRLNLFH